MADALVTIKLTQQEISDIIIAMQYAKASHKRTITTTQIPMVKQGHTHALLQIEKIELKLKEAK